MKGFIGTLRESKILLPVCIMAPTLTRYILLILKWVLEQGYTNFSKIY